MKKMRIKIDQNGKTTIAVEGAASPACLDFTRAMEQAVGEVDKRVLCEEYHQEETLSENVNLEERL